MEAEVNQDSLFIGRVPFSQGNYINPRIRVGLGIIAARSIIT